MRKVVIGTGLLIALAAIFAFAQPATQVEPVAKEAKINWLTWEEAMVAMENNPKKMFIDVYTDWCGWCKRMDANTFTDGDVIDFMNENYYAVKFNAESTPDQQYKGNTLSFQAGAGRRGVHELAVVLLNRRLGYPSFVYLDEQQNSLKISPGYKTPDVLLVELKAVAAAN
ncbi:MAG: thioredoxin family protein [Lewinella sp.]|jgi:thioredoxin-related protein|uniref:thioredoxin family protein n=1 Tax=Lewinella sp. TaxID=2004506 RepID=UPI003D6B4C52